MSGHSKWANTKHRKASQDAKKGKIFTKIIREIVASSKTGGSDPNLNSRLRTAIDKALTHNMPRDTINRAIIRGTGHDDEINMESFTYEGYGPGGTAILIQCLSDNRNRTVSTIRHAFSKTGGNLGTDGSVSYLFKKTGIISFLSSSILHEDSFIETVLELGADDIINNNDKKKIDIYTSVDSLLDIKNSMIKANYIPQNFYISFIPSIKINLDIHTAPKLLNFIDLLEDSEDVQDIFHNGNIPHEINYNIL